ncbi:MAG: ABC transporter permease subunit [Chitinophagaceae bacterium]|nr:ABC transporter permease subunit [Chitinophagaceae bacterium]MCW5928904.1 ABC transporter permease subunit [Chitinophagaceae bacterium]
MKTIFLFELKNWLRNKAVWLVLITWVLLVSFAGWQRNAIVCMLASDMDSSRVYELQKEKAYHGLLDSVERGLKQVKEYANDPRNPVYFNTKVPRFAIYEPGVLDVLATGQSDIFPQLYVISSRADYRQQKEEAVNGLPLMYGKPDMVFIITFLFPLIIIAFNYGLLSSEKESGTLKLILVQHTNLKQVLFAKLFVSFLFSLLLLLVPAIILYILKAGAPATIRSVGLLLLITSLYSLFWHLLCAVAGSRLKSSAWNATVLTGCWILLTVLLPAVINLVTGSVRPVPSRTEFITEYRRATNAIEQDSNSAVLDKFFFDHPELAKEDSTGNERNRANQFYKASHIKHDQTHETLQPIYDRYESSLQAANRFSGNVGLLSPALTTHQSLLLLAGQSSKQYLHFNKAIVEWRKPYLDFILTNLLQDKDVNRQETLKWSSFSYQPYDYSSEMATHISVMLLFIAALLLITLKMLQRAVIIN